MTKIYSFISKFFLALSFCCTMYGIAINAQDVHLEWVRQIGGNCGNSDEDDAGTAIAIDAAGNVYTAGWFCGSVDFDNSDTGTFILTSTSNYGSDYFIAKHDAKGDFVWAKHFKDLNYYSKLILTVDPQGSMYLTGSFEGVVDFNPNSAGKDTLISNEMSSAFFLKLDTDGNFVWVKRISGSPYSYVAPYAMTAKAGYLYITGTFRGGEGRHPSGNNTINFNPNGGTANVTANSSSTTDIFILKLDTAGNFSWVRKMDGTSSEEGTAIAVDYWGNVYTTGGFLGTVDFDPGTGVASLTAATSRFNTFVSKLDSSGKHVWVKGFLADEVQSPSGMSQTQSISVDPSGNVYTSGYFYGTVNFEPGTSTNILNSSSGAFFMFIAKLNASGDLLWVKSSPSSSPAHHAIDSAGNIVYAVSFDGIVDFDPGVGTYNLTSFNSYSDIAIVKLTTDARFVWAKSITGNSAEKCYGIALDPSGQDVFTTGLFAGYGGGWADFNPSEKDTLRLFTGDGSSDAFIHKMSCNTINALTEVVCDSFKLGANVYTESGVYTQRLPNALGCDSIVTLHLTVNKNVDTITETACLSFSQNGETYTENGLYPQKYTNVLGCDSIIILDLTVSKIDTAVIVKDMTLTAKATDASYQWVDCDLDYEAIAGATNQSYTATSRGNYAVIITQNGCSDTSFCYNPASLSLQQPDLLEAIKVYPNPTHQSITINIQAALQQNTSFNIFNAIGQQIYPHNILITNNTTTVNLDNLAAGIYILEVTKGKETAKIKLVKN